MYAIALIPFNIYKDDSYNTPGKIAVWFHLTHVRNHHLPNMMTNKELIIRNYKKNSMNI